MTGFMGMGMAMNAGGGMNAQNLFAMGQQQQTQHSTLAASGRKCSAGAVVTGKTLPRMRQQEAGACGRQLEVQMWSHSCRKVLSGVRLS